MGESIFDYETKAFLSILAISLIGMAIVVSQQPMPNTASFVSNLFKKAPSNTFIIKNIDIGENIGKDTPTLTKNDLTSLADGNVKTNSGKTNYSQYLIIKKTGTDGFEGGSILFGRDDSHNPGNYLYFQKNSELFEYALIFSSGLQSRIENNKLVDAENQYLNIMGKTFVIVQTYVDTQQKIVKLRLMGTEGVLDFEDKNYGDNQYEQGVRINNKQIDAKLKITAFSSNNRFTITEIRYAPFATTQTKGDVYIAPRQGLRGRLRDPKAMLVPSLELIYSGVSGGGTTQGIGGGEFILFTPKGTDKYDLSFTNDLGINYDIPLVSASKTFKYGSETKSLVFNEGNNNADYNINKNDYFVVNSKIDINGVTNIIEYNGINNDDSKIYFFDIGTGEKKTVPFDPNTRLGYLAVFGTTYLFYVSNSAPYLIVVDQNNDGIIDGGEAKVVIRGGGRLDLGSNNIISGNSITLTLTTPKRLFAEPTTDELVSFTITKSNSNLDITVPNQNTITMYRDKARMDKGLTRFGVYFLRDQADKTSSQLIIEYPRMNAFAMPTTAQGQAAIAVTLEREKYLRKQE